MAMPPLQPFITEGDRPAPAAQPGMVKLPDGSLIMRGAPKAIEKPGMLAGLRNWVAEKLSPAPPVDKYWIPQPAAPAAPVAPAAAAPGTPLPAYDAWSEIEQEVAKEKAIADKLGAVSSNILNNERLIQGKWFSPSAPKRIN